MNVAFPFLKQNDEGIAVNMCWVTDNSLFRIFFLQMNREQSVLFYVKVNVF